MTASLQKKFVRTAMVAVTVLMVLMLGAINVANILMVDRQVEKTLLMIAENEGSMPPQPMTPPQTLGRDPENTRDAFQSARFFLIRFDPAGNVVLADISRVASLTEADALQLARRAYESGDGQGRAGGFRYVLRPSRTEPGTVAVFLDASGERHSYGQVLLLSVGIGVVCWAGMLLLVRLLSRRAIRPIEENIRRQKEFITNAGHEIKPPLSIIQANTEAMELYGGENKYSRNIRTQITRLTGLTNELLSLARMEEGSPTMFSQVSLSLLLEESAETFRQPLELNGITLHAEIAGGVCICGNRERLAQLLSVLLDNAAKYTNPGGQVQVRLQRTERLAQLTVANSVARLPDVPAEKLFDRFYRADDARTQRSGGYGIGLSVGRAIAQTHGGTLTARYDGQERICFTAQFRLADVSKYNPLRDQ